MGKGQGQPSKRRRRNGRQVADMATMMLLIALPLSLFFLPTAILLAAGMLPTFVAWISDRTPGKTAPMTVGAVNLVGCIAFVIQLWLGNNSLAGVAQMLGDPFVWFGMYGAAAVGWAFYYGIPPLVALSTAGRAQARIKKLREQQAALVEEWGAEVGSDGAEDAA